MMFARIKLWLAIAAAAVVSILSFGALKKREGRKEERRRAQEADYENAADIRDRVDRNLDQRVREMDGRGFRD